MLALAVVGIGAVAGLAALALTSRSPAELVEPAPTATARPSPDASAEPSPASTDEIGEVDQGRRADLTDLAEQVAEIRQLPLQGRLRARVLDGPSLADKVSSLAFSDTDPEEVEADERLLVALRLAEPDTDLLPILEALYREQILGLYVPEERRLYVKGDGRESEAQRLTSAHEIVHALQDQSFDLFAMQESVKEDVDSDAALAMVSLIEGDAVLTQELWAQQHLTVEERQEAMAEAGTGGQALAEAPDYLRAGLFFPYEAGAAFVVELYRNGGFAAVDAAFAQPPTTSEQILHPEKYRAGEAAVPVRVRSRPGSGWRRSATYEFGEFDLHEMLSVLPGSVGEVAAQGWGGGQVRSWTNGEETAVGFVLAFDSEQDTREACDALPRWYAAVADGEQQAQPDLYTGDRDHMALRCETTRVHVGLAPGTAVARNLAGSG